MSPLKKKMCFNQIKYVLIYAYENSHFRCKKRFPFKNNKVNPIENEQNPIVTGEKIKMDNLINGIIKKWTKHM
jgi:hypothetical protein